MELQINIPVTSVVGMVVVRISDMLLESKSEFRTPSPQMEMRLGTEPLRLADPQGGISTPLFSAHIQMLLASPHWETLLSGTLCT